jgi:hypothetical protein
MAERLTIVVPYRDRAAHLEQFVPHLRAYFARDKADCHIPYRVLVVEQEPGLPFNRGALKNIGFRLGRDDGDYTCFHDIDYLPLWADYSPVPCPTRIVWYGAENRPLAPGRSDLIMSHDLETFFGAVVLTPNRAFAAVDGYSNQFWGWGCEDSDLRLRYHKAGIATAIRKGTFVALDHDHDGCAADGNLSPAAVFNQALLDSKWAAGGGIAADGLSTLDFDIVDRRPLPDAEPERAAPWEIVTVRLRPAIRPDQLAAFAALHGLR